MEFYTDADGRMWRVIDFKLMPRGDKKRRLATGHLEADGRAFHREVEQTRIYWFNRVAYRDLGERTLAEQFKNSRPTAQAAARQFWDRTERLT